MLKRRTVFQDLFLSPLSNFTLPGYAVIWCFGPGSSGNSDNSFAHYYPGDCTAVSAPASCRSRCRTSNIRLVYVRVLLA